LESNQKSQSVDNKDVSGKSKTVMVQNPVHNSQICPDLAQIIAAWPTLTEDTRQAIKALVETAKQK
jgi:hypothetical protein